MKLTCLVDPWHGCDFFRVLLPALFVTVSAFPVSSGCLVLSLQRDAIVGKGVTIASLCNKGKRYSQRQLPFPYSPNYVRELAAVAFWGSPVSISCVHAADACLLLHAGVCLLLPVWRIACEEPIHMCCCALHGQHCPNSCWSCCVIGSGCVQAALRSFRIAGLQTDYLYCLSVLLPHSNYGTLCLLGVFEGNSGTPPSKTSKKFSVPGEVAFR